MGAQHKTGVVFYHYIPLRPAAHRSCDMYGIIAAAAMHRGSFYEFYCCLKFAYDQKKLVKSWQCNIKEAYFFYLKSFFDMHAYVKFGKTNIVQWNSARVQAVAETPKTKRF